MNATTQMEAGRPAHMRSMPVKFDRVFNDPEARSGDSACED